MVFREEFIVAFELTAHIPGTMSPAQHRIALSRRPRFGVRHCAWKRWGVEERLGRERDVD